MQVKMKLDRTTPGALLYREIGDKGQPLDMQDSAIGSLYIRKHSELGKTTPAQIIVTVEANNG